MTMFNSTRRRLHITFLVLLCWMNFLAGQSLLEQKVDFEVKNSTIADAIFLLSEQTGWSISFDSSIFPKQKKISINKTATVKEILEDCLKGYNVQYQVDDTSVLLLAKRLEKRTLSGYMEDDATGEALIGATIFDTKTGKGTTTNEYGFFSLTLVEGEYDLNFSYLGYQVEKKRIVLTANKDLNVRLKTSLVLAEVLVVAPINTSVENVVKDSSETIEILNPARNTAASSLGGEVDILQRCYALAGVETGADGFGGMHVRGGEVGQNLTLMDGVPVYNPSHALGLISIFNANTVKQAAFQKDGFSARYGGRLSSVLDVRTKEGNNQRFSGEVKLGTIAASLALEGPIVKDKASFFLSARRSILEPLVGLYAALAREEEKISINYGFQDFNGKVNWRLNSKNRLFLSYYSGSDSYLDDDNFEENLSLEPDDESIYRRNYLQDISWGNLISSLRWNHQYGSKLFSNLTATYSRYNYDSFTGSEFAQLDEDNEEIDRAEAYLEFKSNIIERALRFDFDYSHSPIHSLEFGGSYRYRSFDSGVLFAEDLDDDIELDSAEAFFERVLEENYFHVNEFALYAQDNIRWKAFSANTGLRTTGFTTEGKNYYAVEPRLALNYALRPNVLLGLTATYMAQYVHLLSSFGAGLPNDIWVPSTRFIKPQRSWQWTLGADWGIKEEWTLRSEVYYKIMNQMLAYQESVGLPQLTQVSTASWEEEVVSGKGESYGWETSLKKNHEKYTTGVNYTLAKSTRKFERLNGGSSFPFSFDSRHSLKLYFNYKATKNTHFSLNWQYTTGRPITLVRSSYSNFLFGEGFDNVDILSRSKNDYRLPANHRLNLGVDFHFPTKWGGHQLSLGLYNAYHRRNVLYEYESLEEENITGRALQRVTLLPILPVVGYRLFLGR